MLARLSLLIRTGNPQTGLIGIAGQENHTFVKMTKIVRLGYLTLFDIADEKQTPGLWLIRRSGGNRR
jgi:hypothetical protein